MKIYDLNLLTLDPLRLAGFTDGKVVFYKNYKISATAR